VSAGPAYDAKEQIRQAIDIVDLVGSSLQLRRQGHNYVALCPWHDDSRPSLQINPERQSWKCWVCDIGGDIFSFTMKREGVDFREALVMLADRAGISMAKTPANKAEPGSPGDKQTLYQAVAWAEQQFHQFLLQSPEAEAARLYLEDRGITPESVERFRIGYAPNSWNWLLDRARSSSFSPQVLSAIGVLGKSEKTGKLFDMYRGRVIFPIHDTQHRPIAFGGRILPQIEQEEEQRTGRKPAKYYNSPETRLFTKSDQLYGLDIALNTVSKSKQLIVVEGYTDVVMANQFGVEDVTAVLGTALNQRHIRLIRRFADCVTLVLDGDEAGQTRTNQILELFIAANMDLRILALPEGLDPCDFLLERGADEFRSLIESAVDALDHKISVECRGVDLTTDTHRATAALENILGTIATMPQDSSVGAGSTRLREQQLLTRLARQFRVPDEDLRQRLKELRQRTVRRSTAQEPVNQRESGLSSMDHRDAELIEILVTNPELVDLALEQIETDELSTDATRTIFEIYHQLFAAGVTADYDRVMTELEEPSLKYILEFLADRAQRKAEVAEDDEVARLQGLIQAYQFRREEKEKRSQLAALEHQDLNEQEELEVLRQRLEKNRIRQGISAPTDG
jgi:DNA primase